MHALVYFIVRFIYVTLGLGSGGRGPGSSDDIHLDPISHPNTQDLTGGKSIKQSLGTAVPAAFRKQVISHFPLEERSSDAKGVALASGTVRSEAGELVNVFPFPNSHKKICEDKEINAVQEFRGTAKNFSSNSLSLWLGVVGLMAHLWG
jgi:hypothetical protein